MSDPLGGLAPAPPPPPAERQVPRATLALLAILGLVFAVECVMGGTALGDSNIALMRLGALYLPAVRDGDLFRVGSYAFLHIGWVHILSNGASIWVVGSQIEFAFTADLMLGFFSATALAGGAASLFWAASTGHLGLAAGASAGAFGLFGAMIALLFRVRHRFSREARGRLIGQLVLNLLINVGIALKFPVDNAAHLGGLASGIVLGMLAPQRSLPDHPWQTLVRWLSAASIPLLAALEVVALVRAREPRTRLLRGDGAEARVDALFVPVEPGTAVFPGVGAIQIGPDTEAQPSGKQVQIDGRSFRLTQAAQDRGTQRTLLTGEAEGHVELVCVDPYCQGDNGEKIVEATARTLRIGP